MGGAGVIALLPMGSSSPGEVSFELSHRCQLLWTLPHVPELTFAHPFAHSGPAARTLNPCLPPEPPPLASWSPLSSSPLPSALPDSPKADVVRLLAVEAAVGGMVSMGCTVGLGILDVVQDRDVGEGVGWLWGTLLGARGRALGGDGSASLRICSKLVTDADVGCVPRTMASARRGELGAGVGTGRPSWSDLGGGSWAIPWHGPRLWVEMSRPWRQAIVFSWHSLPYVMPSDPQTWGTGQECSGKSFPT